MVFRIVRKRIVRKRIVFALTLVFGSVLATSPTLAFQNDVLHSVVSVLPVWPGQPQGGVGRTEPGEAPEGSGIVIAPGVIATAWHVIEPARRVDIGLSDGRVIPAQPIAYDAATDIALLGIDVDLPVFPLQRAPALASDVCAVGNAYGLGISVTCGVVSQTGVTNAGFNAVEDFIQTDAAVNPGMSGGALVDGEGQLVGMLSAIFSNDEGGSVGVNFAVSAALLDRVAQDLLDDFELRYPEPGWALAPASLQQRRQLAAPAVTSVDEGGAAAKAGVQAGDRILKIGERDIRSPQDAVTALALVPLGEVEVALTFGRNGAVRTVSLPIETEGTPQASAPVVSDCPHPDAVCLLRQAVFPISSYDPVGSATRIAADLLVTNRHVVGDQMTAIVHTPTGPLEAQVVPSSYAGDLALLRVEGLPADGYIPALEAVEPSGRFYAVGADIARQVIRVFAPGAKLADPADGAELGRLHVTAQMQPGVSGGALVDDQGTLVGIAVGGGQGRFQAIPIIQVAALIEGQDGATAALDQARIGSAYVGCNAQLDRVAASGRSSPEDSLVALEEICLEAANFGQLLEAGRLLSRVGAFDGAISAHALAVEQVPNSLNGRISLLTSLQIGGRVEEMVPHARWIIEAAPEDPSVMRFGIQAGAWTGDVDLAEAAYAKLLEADPRQAPAARRFIDNPSPPPPRR